jgi:hypothetical protein
MSYVLSFFVIYHQNLCIILKMHSWEYMSEISLYHKFYSISWETLPYFVLPASLPSVGFFFPIFFREHFPYFRGLAGGVDRPAYWGGLVLYYFAGFRHFPAPCRPAPPGIKTPVRELPFFRIFRGVEIFVQKQFFS